MSKKSPSPPPAPDPYAVAKAQTGSNIDTAIANTAMGNANEITPYGTIRYEQSGSRSVDGRDVPIYNRITELSPEQRQLYDQETAIGRKAGDIALTQADRIATTLAAPTPAAPTLRNAEQYLGAGGVSGVRDRVETALMARLNPQLAADRSSLEARLAAEGMGRGSQAFNSAIDESNRQTTDARLAVIGAAGTEQDRSFNEALAAAGFDNSVLQQGWQNQMAARSQPINEISALMGLGQVQTPQGPAYQAGQVAGTPVGQYVYQSAQQNLDAWKTQQATKAQTMGQLFGLGGSLVGAFARSDRRVKRDIVPLAIRLPTGLPLYAYRYRSDGEAGHVHVGVMADEVRPAFPAAVFRGPDGFDLVDYARVL